MENTQIVLKNKNGQEYILEYNRESVQQVEKLGFSIKEIDVKPMTMFPLMFRGSFLKNHKYVKEKEINEIYNALKDKQTLHTKLIEMITECYNSLFDENSAEDIEGNADWEIA